jgi:hypothetical protein
MRTKGRGARRLPCRAAICVTEKYDHLASMAGYRSLGGDASRATHTERLLADSESPSISRNVRPVLRENAGGNRQSSPQREHSGQLIITSLARDGNLSSASKNSCP